MSDDTWTICLGCRVLGHASGSCVRCGNRLVALLDYPAELVRDIIRRRGATEVLGARMVSLREWPPSLSPVHAPTLRGTAHGTPGVPLPSAIHLAPTGRPHRPYLRLLADAGLTVRAERGTIYQVEGVIDLVAQSGEAVPIPIEEPTPAIPSVVPRDSEATRYGVVGGQPIEVWGTIREAFAQGAYRDAPVNVLRGEPGRPVLVRPMGRPPRGSQA